jgi:hypothetical protein
MSANCDCEQELRKELKEYKLLFKRACEVADSLAAELAIEKSRGGTVITKTRAEARADDLSSAVTKALNNPAPLSPIKSWTIGDGVSDDHAR